MTRVRGLTQVNAKNRSSKQLRWMTGPGTKPITWSMSGEALRAAAKDAKKGNIYDAEILRRKRNAEKRKTPRPTFSKKA